MTESHLDKVVSVIDKVLIDFGQPEFYNPPKFHVSIAWCLGPNASNEAESIEETTGTNDHDTNMAHPYSKDLQKINEEFEIARKTEVMQDKECAN